MAEFIKKLRNTEVELKKSVAHKKSVYTDRMWCNLYQWWVGMLFIILKVILFTLRVVVP